MATTNHAVLIDTNLNTNLAVMISDIDTAVNLKQNIVLEHFKSFPMHGNITVNAIKVKRNKCFYHIPDSVLVKNVFQRVTGTWFLYVDADAENHSKQALEPEKLLATSTDLPVKHVESSLNEKKIAAGKQVKSIPTLSHLKRKLFEASPDTEAKVIPKTSIKKKKSSKVSDAETGLLSAGARKDDSTSVFVPVKSKKFKAASSSCLTSKKFKVASSSCLEKEQNDIISRDFLTSPGENKRKENIVLKKVITSSMRKAAAASNKSSKCVPKDGKAGGENSEIPSGILEHNMKKGYLEGVNGSTNEDPKSSAAAETEGIDFLEHFLPKEHKVV